MLVLVYLVIEYGKWYEIPNTGTGYLLRHGWVGVDLFFTLSGFVIALSALDGVRNNLYHSTHGFINGPSWSVALEMQFYLTMVLAAPWLARTGSLRVLVYAVLIAAALPCLAVDCGGSADGGDPT